MSPRKGKRDEYMLSKDQLRSLFGDALVKHERVRAVGKIITQAIASENGEATPPVTHYAIHDGRKVWNAEWIERLCSAAAERGCMITPRALVVVLELLEEIPP